ncbi:MAG: hypothetical protein JXN59_11540 [Anaerolineae bacterium]|nr:hypothetical protein [Anaerolineae bacterium]
MATTTFQLNNDIFSGFRRFKQRVTARGLWFGLILLAALAAFELFNFATTEFALQSLFGAHDALGIATWAKVLAIAFCGIDFAGLSRLFTPETGRKEPREIWLLTGAWFLGAGMNAVMTWWAVTSALAENPLLGNELISRGDILRVGPIFIAALVWLTRILIIGTFAFAGDHMFSTAGQHSGVIESRARPVSSSRPAQSNGYAPAQPRAVPKPSERRSLPERSMPLASSAYAQPEAGENPRYGTQRNFFGSGAGGYREPAASVSATPPASGSSSAFGTRPAPAAPAAPVAIAAPVAPAATVAAAPASPQRAEPVRPAPQRPSAFDGPSARAASSVSSRASTTRTISPKPERAPAPEQSMSGPAAMELEYVDLD